MEAWKIFLIVINIIIVPIIIYFGRKTVLKKLIKNQYEVDKVISDGVISNFPKKILVENINNSDNVSIITLSIDDKINAIDIKCIRCNTIFSIKDHKENTDIPMEYEYECPNCGFKYFSSVFIDNSRNNEMVLIFDKKH